MPHQPVARASSSTLPRFLRTDPPPVDPPSIPRLQALYASTSAQRISNATGYAANAAWWAKALQESLAWGWANGEEGDRLVLKLDEGLVEKFEWDGIRPKGLAGVVESQVTTTPPALHSLSHFLSSLIPLHGPASIARRFVGRPLYWAFSQLNPFGTTEKDVKEEDLWKSYGKGREYVHMPLLESAAAQFVSHMDENPLLVHRDALYDHESFRQVFGRVCLPARQSRKGKGRATDEDGDGVEVVGGRAESLSRRDVEVLVKWLMRDLAVVVTDGNVIKVLAPGETVADNPITEVDENILTVMKTLKRAEAQIDSLEEQIARCHTKAKSYLSTSQRTLAMSQLKSKKALEEILLRRTGVADRLREVVRSIDEAQNDVEVMRAYQTSTTTLRTLLSNSLLHPDQVERTADDLAETLANQKEVDDAIRGGGSLAVGAGGVEVDEGELELELERLVAEEKAAQEQRAKRERDAATAREKVEEEERQAEKRKGKEEQKGVPVSLSADTAETKGTTAEAVRPTSSLTMAAGNRQSTEKIRTQAEAEREARYDEAQRREKEERQRAAGERMRMEKWAIAE